MSKKEKKKSVFKIILFVFIIIGVISAIGVISYKLIGDTNKKSEEKNTKQNIEEIKGYGITLDDKDTKLYKDEYFKLKENLTSESINYDEYALSVAKLFIIDLYTINNKLNKYDVGGVEFVYPEKVENYTTNVTDTIYKYVIDNTDNKRTQSLPEVSSINANIVEKTKFTINAEDKKDEKVVDAYKINATWDYVTDMGYDKTGEIIVANIDNKLYVVEKN